MDYIGQSYDRALRKLISEQQDIEKTYVCEGRATSLEAYALRVGKISAYKLVLDEMDAALKRKINAEGALETE